MKREDLSTVENTVASEENGGEILMTQEKVTKVPNNYQIFPKTKDIILKI